MDERASIRLGLLLQRVGDLLPRLAPPERVVALLATNGAVRRALLQQGLPPPGTSRARVQARDALGVVLECKRHWQPEDVACVPDFLRFREMRVELRVLHRRQLRVVCASLSSALESGWAGVREFKLSILEPLTPSSRRAYRILFRQHEALNSMQRHRKTAGEGWYEERVPDDDGESPFFSRLCAADVEMLGGVLARMPNLECLDLAGAFMGDDAAEVLCARLAAGARLASAEARECGERTRAVGLRLKRLNLCLNDLSERSCPLRLRLPP